MPNWCYGDVSIKGNPKDIEEFCKLFLFEGVDNSKRTEYFARSFTEITWEDFVKTGNIEALRELYYSFDLHETYISEIRKKLLKELNQYEKSKHSNLVT